MPHFCRGSIWFRLLTITTLVLCLSGCSPPATKASRPTSVKPIGFSRAQAVQLEERARQTAESLYPRVCALLNDGQSTFPESFEIRLKHNLRNGNVAHARFNRIELNVDYLDQFTQNPEFFDAVVVHEMAHIAQHYWRPLIGTWVILDPRPPQWLVEGIADYTCFKLGQTNSPRCAECTSVYAHYRDGYSCAAAFLAYIEQTYSPDLVPRLNSLLRRGGYEDEFFVHNTGKDLAALWMEFQQTSAFTPAASQMLELQIALGYSERKPPKDIHKRLDRFMEQHLDEHTRKLMRGARVVGLKAGSVHGQIALLQYFRQPGGTAEACIVALQESHRLPGFTKKERGTLNGFMRSGDLSPTFPAVREFTATKVGDSSTFHYTLVRPSTDTCWALSRAWRTSPEGRTLEEFSLP